MLDTSKTLLVFGEKTFKITVPAAARITFGPFSPPTKNGGGYGREQLGGTLRVYMGTSIHAVFTGVTGFREESMDYSEQVVIEEGSAIWKSDQRGYERSENVQRDESWVSKGLGAGEMREITRDTESAIDPDDIPF